MINPWFKKKLNALTLHYLFVNTDLFAALKHRGPREITLTSVNYINVEQCALQRAP